MAEKGPSLADISAQIDARLGQISTQATKTDYIGLPSSSSSNVTGAYMDEPQTQGRGSPIYHDGAQDMPIMSNWDKVKVSQLQHRLVQAGVLDDDYRDGYWDGVSSKAFEQILGESNLMGTADFNLAIDRRINSQPMEIDPKTGLARRKAPGSGGSKRDPLAITLSNADDLASTAQTVAQKRIGRTLRPDELNRFVKSYHAAESGAQTSHYADQTGGGATQSEASPEVAANTFAEQIDPVAAQARNMLPMVKSISDLLNGSDDIRTTQPVQGGFSG